MEDQDRISVMLHWRSHDGAEQARRLAFVDQAPCRLIPSLVGGLGLPGLDRAENTIVYQLHLGGERRPALKPEQALSRQQVRADSVLWLVPAGLRPIAGAPRCLLQLPEGGEIVVGSQGQDLTRRWLVKCLALHDPSAYRRERERFRQGRSAYQSVANRTPHCTLRLGERDEWLVTTTRGDVVTEYASGRQWQRIPVGEPTPLDSRARLRLGGRRGLEIGITLV